MTSAFVAYASGNKFHGQLIEEACEQASTADRRIRAWSQNDTSGAPISASVEDWIDSADAFIADISSVSVVRTFGADCGVD